MPGCRKFKQNVEKGLSARRVGRYFREKSGVLASCTRADGVFDAEYLDCEGGGKIIYKENTEQKMGA